MIPNRMVLRRQPGDHEVEEHLIRLNQFATSIEAERKIGNRLWNRASNGGPPLRPEQIAAIRKALGRLAKAAA